MRSFFFFFFFFFLKKKIKIIVQDKELLCIPILKITNQTMTSIKLMNINEKKKKLK